MQLVIGDNGEVVATQEMIEEVHRADFISRAAQLNTCFPVRVARDGQTVAVFFLDVASLAQPEPPAKVRIHALIQGMARGRVFFPNEPHLVGSFDVAPPRTHHEDDQIMPVRSDDEALQDSMGRWGGVGLTVHYRLP